jgi:hypothetical protein
MYLPVNSPLPSKFSDLCGIEHRSAFCEHAADLGRAVFFDLQADPGFPAFVAGTFVFCVFVLAMLWRYFEGACVWAADGAMFHGGWRLDWVVESNDKMAIEDEEEEIELVWDWCSDGHLVEITCFGGHQCFQGRSPFRQLSWTIQASSSELRRVHRIIAEVGAYRSLL